MVGLLLACALSACGRPAVVPDVALPEAVRSECSVAYVVDGDTIQATCPARPGERVRLVGFDTPETFEPRCDAEAALGEQAKIALRSHVDTASRIDLQLLDERDRYGRRLGRLALDGSDAGEILIFEGLALPYHGGARPDWCARLRNAA